MRPLIVSLTLAALLVAAAAAAGSQRAVWMWSWGGADQTAAEIRAGGVTDVFLYAEGGYTPHRRAVISALVRRGVRVQALAGERYWVRDSSGLRRFIRRSNRYQRASGSLSSVHLDIEPYALKAWERRPDHTARQLLRCLRWARRHSVVPVSADIPFWYDGIRIKGVGLARRVIEVTDQTAVMAYRDEASEILSVSEDELRTAERLGKKLWIGVEVSDVTPEKITFYQEGAAALAGAIAEVTVAAQARSSFQGLAIHHWGSLRELERAGGR